MNVTLETYIQAGDTVAVMFRSTEMIGFTATVLEVTKGRWGTRTIIVLKEGTDLARDGAVGIPETHAVFSVRRGDSWVNVPLPLLLDEAEAKVTRMNANERKRIQEKAPLFADQIEIQDRSAERWVANELAADQEKLERDHSKAMAVNELRTTVEALVIPADAEYIRQRRERYPKDAVYGTYFWRKQLKHIEEHGEIERLTIVPSLNQSLKLEWLKHDQEVTWATCPDGPQKVTITFFGRDTIMCRLTGEARMRAEAKQESQQVWLKPEDLAEFQEQEKK
jgi:hypothetical protein